MKTIITLVGYLILSVNIAQAQVLVSESVETERVVQCELRKWDLITDKTVTGKSALVHQLNTTERIQFAVEDFIGGISAIHSLLCIDVTAPESLGGWKSSVCKYMGPGSITKNDAVYFESTTLYLPEKISAILECKILK